MKSRAPKAKKDQRIDGVFYKKLAKPRDDINHLIGVPYDHWDYVNTADGKKEEQMANINSRTIKRGLMNKSLSIEN